VVKPKDWIEALEIVSIFWRLFGVQIIDLPSYLRMGHLARGTIFTRPRSHSHVAMNVIVEPLKAVHIINPFRGFGIFFAGTTMIKMKYADRWWQNLIPSGVAFAIG